MARYKHGFRHWVKDYFTFTKWQRRALIMLLAIAIILIVLPATFPYILSHNNTADADSLVVTTVNEWVVRRQLADTAANDEADVNNESWREPAGTAYNPKISFFPFDPNTAFAADFAKLGMKPKTIQTILHYREKGGRFRKPEDLLKIYGLPKELAEKLMPYVVIADIEKPRDNDWKRDSGFTKTKTEKAIAKVDINLADTSQWIALPGIGSKLASRIVNFRDKLGGFYSIEQVGETYALPDSTFQKIRPRLLMSNGPFRFVNINSANVEEIKAHPYVKWNEANAIVQFRTQHGRYGAVDDLLKIAIISSEWLQRMKPYLKLE